MCLIKDDKNTKQYARTIKSKGGKIVCWKKLQMCENGLHSVLYYHRWKPGWNNSDRLGALNSNLDRPDTSNEINHGIHVYKRKPRSYGLYDRQNIYLVPITCYLGDLLGANKAWKDAVFTRVYLKKSDYNKVVKQHKKIQKEKEKKEKNS